MVTTVVEGGDRAADHDGGRDPSDDGMMAGEVADMVGACLESGAAGEGESER
ncbi:MAG TPA: hypothetical protein VI653_05045 [Steroidobacteraceae bacterium]